ncbi:tetratricopeptide repeat protein [Haliscomenobacter hydrossis]|uniref:Tetratricopeptide TPR_2 repeat-containing protein n=1 Tax=Haliscomenobacter hydrossis (strain ATCC 27775 / DSM 1100 / LMG 10767 / O) TaxID=760192 RepID=F4KZK1_HALH1|nr:tetratricopeptide repeat protein [Haliscomenobacter hydrossis]AEE49471.1 Tetratricopeptide TPR_2 repeat-containing protein [Haliscomenobacter hydrossis DSM 1100]
MKTLNFFASKISNSILVLFIICSTFSDLSCQNTIQGNTKRNIFLDSIYKVNNGGQMTFNDLQFKLLDQAIELEPQNPDLYQLRYLQRSFSPKFKTNHYLILSDLYKLTELYGNKRPDKAAEAYENIAFIYVEAKNYNKALPAIEESIKLLPTDSNYGWQAEIYRNLGNYHKEIEAYTNAFSKNPQRHGFIFMRGKAKVNINDLQGAITDFKQCIGINQKLIQNGLATLDQNDIGIEKFKIDKWREELGIFYLNLGSSQLELGKDEEACISLFQAIEYKNEEAKALVEDNCPLSLKKPNTAYPNDWIIVPGERYGRIPFDVSFKDLAGIVGVNNVKNSNSYVGEGNYMYTTLIFPSTKNQVSIRWENEKMQKIIRVEFDNLGSDWRLNYGIKIGDPLSKVRLVNQKTFNVWGPNPDMVANAGLWHNGKISEKVFLLLNTAFIDGDGLGVYMGTGKYEYEDEEVIKSKCTVRSIWIFPDE